MKKTKQITKSVVENIKEMLSDAHSVHHDHTDDTCYWGPEDYDIQKEIDNLVKKFEEMIGEDEKDIISAKDAEEVVKMNENNISIIDVVQHDLTSNQARNKLRQELREKLKELK